jgi:hypothetical protein
MTAFYFFLRPGEYTGTVKVSSVSRAVEGSTVLQNLLFY